MTCRKGVLSADELAGVYTHWPELDPHKIECFKTRSTRHVRLFDKRRGRIVAYDVLDTRPIILAPFLEGSMVINGKHRGTIAIDRECGLTYYSVENPRDLEHGVPKELYEEFVISERLYGGPEPMRGLDAIQFLFERRLEFHADYCVPAGVIRLRDHLPRLR